MILFLLLFTASCYASTAAAIQDIDSPLNTIFQADEYGESGTSISSAGDFNGDGFDDLLIGAGPAASGKGEAFLLYGNINPPHIFPLPNINISSGIYFRGRNPNDGCGTRVSGAGDINQDGFDDIVISAPYADPNGVSNAGEIYVIFGTSQVFSGEFNISSLNGTNGFIFIGISSGNQIGFSSIYSNFDFNSDGFDDILIGANTMNSAFLIYGTSSSFEAQFNYSSLNGTNGFVLRGINSGDQAGASVSSAGDFNSDGFDDLLIGAPYADPNGVNSAGEMYLIFGTNQSFSSEFNLSSLNGTNGFSVFGSGNNNNVGRTVSSAGDFNSDGFDDILIADTGVNLSGRVFILYGTQTQYFQFNLSSLNSSLGVVINGNSSTDYLGQSLNFGDFNTDGYSDISIGAFGADPNNLIRAGQAYLLFGTKSFDPIFNISSINGTNGIIFNGMEDDDYLGMSSSFGDFNNDGFDDLYVSAPYANFYAGYTYFVPGRLRCAIGFYGSDCSTPCPPLEPGSNYISNNCSETIPFTCSVNEYQLFSSQSNLYSCVPCPKDDILGTYKSSGTTSFCEFVFLKKCSSNQKLNVDSTNSYNVYYCSDCEYPGLNPFPNLSEKCECPEGSIDNQEKCVLAAESYQPSVVGWIVYFAGFFGFVAVVFFVSKTKTRSDENASTGISTITDDSTDDINSKDNSKHKDNTDDIIHINTTHEQNHQNHPPFISFHNWKAVQHPSLQHIFQTLSIFIWTPELIHINQSEYLTESQIYHAVNYLKLTPFVPGSNTHWDLSTKIANAVPIATFFQILGLLFICRIPWTSALFDENVFFQWFVLYFGAENYLIGVGISFLIGFCTLLIFNRSIFSVVLHLFSIPLLFNYFSIFNCVTYPKGPFDLDPNETFVELSISGNPLQCWSDIHILFLVISCFMIILSSLVIWKRNVVFPKDQSMKFLLVIFFLVFSNPFRFSPHLQLLTLFLYSSSLIYVCSLMKKSFQKTFQIFLNGILLCFVLIGFLALLIFDSTNVASATLFIITCVFSVMFGLPYVEHLWMLPLYQEFFDGLEQTVAETTESCSTEMTDMPSLEPSLEPIPEPSQSSQSPQSSSKSLSPTPILLIILLLISTSLSVPYQNINSNGIIFNGINLNDRSGDRVSSAGDFNNDGFDDILISSPVDAGTIYLIFGTNSSILTDSFNLSSINETNGITFTGLFKAGWSVSSAGDFNNDGFDDILIGEPFSSDLFDPGTVYLVYGTNNSLGPLLNLSLLDGLDGFIIYGYLDNERAGMVVSSAGDFNNDGFDDILVSSYSKAYLLYGSNSYFGSNFNLSDMNASYGIIFTDLFCKSVSNAGDFNNDGFGDILLGSPPYLIFGTNASIESFNVSMVNASSGVYFPELDYQDLAGNTLSSAGDFNNDGFNDILIGAYQGDANGEDSGESYLIFGTNISIGPVFDLLSINGTNGIVFNGIQAGDLSSSSLSSAGDFNGDGFSDIFIGAENGGLSDAGAGYIIFGTNSTLESQFNLSSINASNGLVISSLSPYTELGRSVSLVGDFNNDGFPDVLIGAPGGPDGISYIGDSILIFGSSNQICPPGFFFSNNQCLSCTPTQDGPQNILYSRTTECSTYEWNLNCPPNSIINTTTNPLGECSSCGNILDGSYPHTFVCLPQCNSGFRLEGNSCVKCPIGQNPFPNNFTTCACRGNNLDESNKCLPRIPFAKTFVVSSVGYFSGFVFFLSLFGVFYIRKKQKKKKVTKPTQSLKQISIENFLNKEPVYENIQDLVQYLFDYTITALKEYHDSVSLNETHQNTPSPIHQEAVHQDSNSPSSAVQHLENFPLFKNQCNSWHFEIILFL